MILSYSIISSYFNSCLTNKTDNSTPSLQCLSAPSKLLRVNPPLLHYIGTLILVGPPLGFLPQHQCIGSHVPYKSLIQVQATCMPETTQPVNRFPLDLSRSRTYTSVLISFYIFRHLISGSSLPLLESYLIFLLNTFSSNAHYHSFCLQQLRVV